ncbi:MAG: alpha/beta hydrolase [Thermoleophilia bacterium]
MSGASLQVESAGQGRRVALVHGELCDARAWGPQWPGLVGLFAACRLDLPGYGGSPLPPAPTCPAAAVLEVLAPADDQVALVGAGIGARVALELAVARPAIVSALVLVAPTLDLDVAGAEPAALLAGRVDACGTASAEARALAADSCRVAHERRTAGEGPFVPLVPDLEARLGEIAAPTLVVAGEHDLPRLRDLADALAAAIPAAGRVDVAGAGPLPSLERPDLVSGMVIGFLARVGVLPSF